MLLKSRSVVFVLVAVFLNLYLFGCQVFETNQNTIPATDDLLDIQIPTPNLNPSKTIQHTQTITPILVVVSSETPESTMSPTPSLTFSPIISLGETLVSPSDGMVIVYIPAGEFQMGSTEADDGADSDEMPQHLVILDAFWMDQTVITNAMYARFLNEMGNQKEERSTWLDAGDEDVLITQQDGNWQPLKGFENYPAVEVTWFGARAYCQWAGRRLPTEAEWEKAARGTLPGTDNGRIYPWGDEINCDKAQYANCGGGLLPVRSKPDGASPFGILGLSGNTWEWVYDWYADDFYAVSPVENPIGPTDGVARVLRGGSWEYDWKHLRAANRRNNGPSVSMHDYGFRCVSEEGHEK